GAPPGQPLVVFLGAHRVRVSVHGDPQVRVLLHLVRHVIQALLAVRPQRGLVEIELRPMEGLDLPVWGWRGGGRRVRGGGRGRVVGGGGGGSWPGSHTRCRGSPRWAAPATVRRAAAPAIWAPPGSGPASAPPIPAPAPPTAPPMTPPARAQPFHWRRSIS